MPDNKRSSFVQLDLDKMKQFGRYLREVAIIVLAWVCYQLYKDNQAQRDKVETVLKSEVQFYKEAYITSSKFNKWLLTVDTTNIRRNH